jgi:hypothetical protein
VRVVERLLVAVGCFLFLIASAAAAQMTGPQIRTFISGNSVYVKLLSAPAGTANKGVIYYAPDGIALYKAGTDRVWHGRWTIVQNTSCVDWAEEPGNPCSKYERRRGKVTIINVTTGAPRGIVVRVRRANVENLVP